MAQFRIRTDLQRIRLGEFALPLGIEPADTRAPAQGYTVSYNTGQDDEPDTYTFHVVVSHERLRPILQKAFQLLPDQVSPIVEVDSFDAYRAVDVFIGREDIPVSRHDFIETWNEFDDVLLEDGSVGAGANSEEPFIEIFLDQWKGLFFHVPVHMRDDIERILASSDLQEVAETWPAPDEINPPDLTIRPVLDLSDETTMDLHDLVFELRRRWNLELNVDPERNLDETGRDLGMTLWNAELAAHSDAGHSAYVVVWASAASLSQLEALIEQQLRQTPEWTHCEFYSVVRVAFDDRPDALEALRPLRRHAEVHLVSIHRGDENDDVGERDPPRRGGEEAS